MEAMAARFIAVHGHRGARAVFPENTMEAFAYAIEAGVDYIELDVLATRDDVLVACHDPVLRRRRSIGPPGTRVVRQLTLERLRAFDCGSRRNRRFRRQMAVPGARIPTLDEVFGLAGRGTFRFNIEVKSFPERPSLSPAPDVYAALVVDAIRRHGLEHRAEVQSFDFRLLREVRRAAPRIPLAALCDIGHPNFVRAAAEAGAASVGPYHRMATRRRVERAHAAGISVVPWTANRSADWRRLVRAGVDGIITDDPAGLIAFLEAHGLRDGSRRV